MNPLVALPLNLLLPILPWIGLSSWWVARSWHTRDLWILLISGIILDLWWAKPLGLTSLILISSAVLIKFLGRVWPSEQRFYWPLSFILSLVIFEIYLVLA